MSQRNSEYARIEGDRYYTPKWVYNALLDVEYFPPPIWDCAPIDCPHYDFLTDHFRVPSIITNPPFKLADQFCRHALELTKPVLGKVAMLLPMAFDAAKGRVDLFSKRPSKIKYVLTKRIRWENLEQKTAGPSMNHAWYVWDWNYIGPPLRGYL